MKTFSFIYFSFMLFSEKERKAGAVILLNQNYIRSQMFCGKKHVNFLCLLQFAFIFYTIKFPPWMVVLHHLDVSSFLLSFQQSVYVHILHTRQQDYGENSSRKLDNKSGIS